MTKIGSADGYLTVEAAMIMPIAFAIIILVLKLWFFGYDRVLQDMDTCAVMVRCTEQRDMDSEERTSYVIDQLQGRYKDSYIAWNFGDISVLSNGNSISCTVTGSSSGINGISGLWNEPDVLSVSSERSRGIMREVFVIRTFRKALGAGDQISAVLSEE